MKGSFSHAVLSELDLHFPGLSSDEEPVKKCSEPGCVFPASVDGKCTLCAPSDVQRLVDKYFQLERRFNEHLS